MNIRATICRQGKTTAFWWQVVLGMGEGEENLTLEEVLRQKKEQK